MRFTISLMVFLGLSVTEVNAREKIITTSDGVKLYLQIEGSGPACLYIHGGPGSGSYWLEKFMGEYLESHFQMIYLDQRGVGRSASPENSDYSLERMTRDFEEVRESLGIQQWITLGHSIGGILQMGYINSHPDVIAGMIFINCTLSLIDSFGTSWLQKALELTGDTAPLTSLDTTKTIYQRMLAIIPVLSEQENMWKLFFNSQENSQRMNETYSSFETWNSDQSEKILEFAEYWVDFRELSAEVKKPVLFFYGKSDWAIGPEHYQGLYFPDMLLWGSEVGHMPFLENREDLINAITAYLEWK